MLSLLGANLISSTGSRVSSVAVPWYVLTRTGSAESTGLAAAASVLSAVLTGALAGTLVDRFGHKRASVVSDVVSAVTVAAIPTMDLLLGFNLGLLLVLLFVSSLLTVPGATARQSLTPELAELAKLPLHRVNAVYSTVQRGTQLVGPAVAGVLIAAVGPVNAIWIDAASFLASAILVSVAVPSVRGKAVARQNYWDDLRAGVSFLRKDALVRSIIVSIAAHNILAAPILAIGLPTYGVTVLRDPVALGVLLAGFGGGAVAGGILYAVFGQRAPRRGLFVACYLVSGVPFGLIGLTNSAVLAFLILVVIGLAAGPINPIIATAIQERVPSEFRARVWSATIAAVYATTPFAMIWAGIAIANFGISPTLQYTGVAYVVVALLGWRFGALADFKDERREVPPLTT